MSENECSVQPESQANQAEDEGAGKEQEQQVEQPSEGVIADQEPEKPAGEEEEPVPEVDTSTQKDDVPEDTHPEGVGESVGEVKEELQPDKEKPAEQPLEEQKPEEPAADDTTKSDDKPKPQESESEESKPKEEAATAAVEQEPPKKEEAKIQPTAPESSAATAEGGQDVTKEAEGVAAAENKEEVKEKPKRPPRNKVRSIIPTEGVDLAMGEGDLEGSEPITFGQMFKMTVSKFADVPALKWKEKEGEGEESTLVWKTYTYSQYYRLCIDAAKSLVKLGLEENHGVGIIGFNSQEWVISNNAAIFAGGLSAGIYATNGPDACHFVLDDSKSNVAIVENEKQLDKILQIRDRLPHLKAIVQYKGKLSQEYDKVYDWAQFLELGKDIEDSVIEDKIKAQKPEQCALLIYTSGTTGNPKGVMLSHDNLTWTAKALYATLGNQYNLDFGNERIISYLPLSHIAAQMEDIYLSIYGATTLYFAQPDVLKGSLLQTLLEVRPTLFFGVPRVWEKVHEKMEAAAAEVTGIKKKIGQWARGVSFEGNTNIQRKRGTSFKFKLANSLILKRIHERIGLDQLKISLSGAAPIQAKTIEFFMSINIPVLELYGMSENSGPHSLNTLHEWRLRSVGHSMCGTYLKIDNPDENGEGEICMYGRHVFMGYLNSEEKTKEAIDDEGWLHSGDIGKVDEDKFIFITGRIKELIITAGGENIAPVPIEDRIKRELPFLSNVMLIGDKRKFVSCLVTLKCEADAETGEPQDELLPEAKTLIGNLGCSCTKISEILESKDEKLYSEITAGLERANKNAVSNAQRVQKFTILAKDFSMFGGELGPTLKLKRHVVVKKYEAQIDAMYEATGEAGKA